jgi:hypothetical protein
MICEKYLIIVKYARGYFKSKRSFLFERPAIYKKSNANAIDISITDRI